MISRGERHLDELTWQQFEQLLGMLMRRKWPDTRVTPPARDGGKDAISYDVEGNVVALGQAKHTASVGDPVVKLTLGAAAVHGASNAVVVTSGKLTKQARGTFEGNRKNGQTYAVYLPSRLRLYIWERRHIVQWLDEMNAQSWEQFRWEVIDGLGEFPDTPEPSKRRAEEVAMRVQTALVALGRRAQAWRQSPKRISLARKSLNELQNRFGASELLGEVENALYEVEAIQGSGRTKRIRTKWDAFLMATGHPG